MPRPGKTFDCTSRRDPTPLKGRGRAGSNSIDSPQIPRCLHAQIVANSSAVVIGYLNTLTNQRLYSQSLFCPFLAKSKLLTRQNEDTPTFDVSKCPPLDDPNAPALTRSLPLPLRSFLGELGSASTVQLEAKLMRILVRRRQMWSEAGCSLPNFANNSSSFCGRETRFRNSTFTKLTGLRS
jgi:hypothetical protein